MKLRYTLFVFILGLTFLSEPRHSVDALSESEIPDSGAFYSAAIAPSGDSFALGVEAGLFLKGDEMTARFVHIEDSNATVNAIAFSHDSRGSMLALGTSSGTVWLYDVSQQKVKLLGKHKWDVVDIAFASDSKIIVSAAADGTIKFWNTQTRRETFSSSDFHKFQSPGGVKATALSPDGRILAIGTIGTLQLWNVTRESLSQAPYRKINLPQRTNIRTITFSPNGKLLAAGAEDGTLFLWNVSKRVSSLTTINRKDFAVTAVAFSPDSEILIAGTENGDISFWDPQTLARKKIDPVKTDRSRHFTAVLSVAFSNNGQSLTSIDAAGSTLAWHLPDISPPRQVVENKAKKSDVTIAERKKAERKKQDTPNHVTPPPVSVPLIEILSPELDANNSVKVWKARLSVKARVTNESGIERVTIGSLTTEEMTPTQDDIFTGSIMFRQPGISYFNIIATPKNGKPITKRIKTNFVKDQTAPYITVSKLTEQIISGTVTDGESGVDLNTVKIGDEKISLGLNGSFTHYIRLNEGDNKFIITAKDRAGNISAPTELTMRREPTPPRVKIIAPELDVNNAAKITDSPFTVSVEVTDESEIAEVRINDIRATSEDEKIFTATILPQTDLTRIEIIAVDKAGGIEVESFAIEFQKAPEATSASSTTTPVSKILRDAATSVSETEVPGGRPTLSDGKTGNFREENDPLITFGNYDLQAKRPHNTRDHSFLLSVIVIDDSQIPIDGVKVEHKVNNRGYKLIGNAVKTETDRFEIEIQLNEGTNEFRITAEDVWSNIERQLFTIVRLPTDSEGPKLQISQVGSQVIRSAQESIVVNDEKAHIRGNVADVSGVHTVEVKGKVETGWKKLPLQGNGSFEANIPLDYGENLVTVRTTDSLRNSTQTSFRIYQQPDRIDKDFALFFATDEYKGKKDRNGDWMYLPTPIKDAEAIAKNLRDNYGFTTKIFKNLPKRVLLQTLYAYSENFEGTQYAPGSQLLIFFSGHGYYRPDAKTGYLITLDTDGPEIDPMMISAIEHKKLSQEIDLIACDRILVLMDTCYSGTFDRDFDPSKSIALKGPLLDAKSSLSQKISMRLELGARWCLTASGVEYVSARQDAGEHSPFAAAFLNALNTRGGEDSLLMLDEIWKEIEKSKDDPIYDQLIEYLRKKKSSVEGMHPEPRKGQFGNESHYESDFLLFPKVN